MNQKTLIYALMLPFLFDNWLDVIFSRIKGKGGLIVAIFRKDNLKLKMRILGTDLGVVFDVFGHKDYTRFFDVNKNDVVIDIGAHIGVFSIYAASKGARVFSYEPEKSNFELLAQNVKLNSFQNRIKYYNFAVSSRCGTDWLFISKNTVSHSLIRTQLISTVIRVKYKKLEQ